MGEIEHWQDLMKVSIVDIKRIIEDVINSVISRGGRARENKKVKLNKCVSLCFDNHNFDILSLNFSVFFQFLIFSQHYIFDFCIGTQLKVNINKNNK